MMPHLCLGCPLSVSICTEAPIQCLTSQAKRMVQQDCNVEKAYWTHLSKDIGERATPINGKSHVPLRHSGNPESSYTVLKRLVFSQMSDLQGIFELGRQDCR